MSQAYVTDITVKCQRDNTTFTFIKAFTRSRKLYESENGGIKFKVKSKEAEVWDQEKFLFLNDYACNLSYVFMDEMNLLY